MKELFASLEHVNSGENYIFLDTCFLFDLFDKGKSLVKGYRYAVSSFNVEELISVSHRLHKDKVQLRRMLKGHSFVVYDIDVHIGDIDSEKKFVKSVDKELLKLIPDASDAVLLALAVKTKSVVLTKDKHHLFTVELENFISRYGIKVYKENLDLLKNHPEMKLGFV